MQYDEIVYEIEDRVLTITLDRPDQLNALTYRMHLEIIDALERADADDDVRCVVVTGRGRGFCAGADLSAGASSLDIHDEEGTIGTGAHSSGAHRDEGGLVALRLYSMSKPVIAAINGAAVGVGATMTLPMDVRLASSAAKFGFVFARRDIVPEACSSWFLPRVVGIGRASEWVMTGRVFDASEALAAGLVSHVYEPDDLLGAAERLALEIAANTSAVSIALSRQMLWRMLGESHPIAAHRVDSQGIAFMGASPDGREGIESFLEKRAPNFPMNVSRDMPPFYPWWEEPAF
ncbi:MAG: Enoyl-CoA hydratase/isomerase [Acidimicrobiales bacterium]|nr:Enoyl-CoA hydratase/isomerase [Acidimicrobiales bacterium]